MRFDFPKILPILIIEGGAWIAVGVSLVIFQLDFFIIKGDDWIWDERDFTAAAGGHQPRSAVRRVQRYAHVTPRQFPVLF